MHRKGGQGAAFMRQEVAEEKGAETDVIKQ